MGCIPWYGDLGDRWLSEQDMMETVVLHMLQGWLQYVEELTSWVRQLLLILVDGYQDGMLSRTTMASGGGGCKDLQSLCTHSGLKCDEGGASLDLTCEVIKL